MNGTDGKARVGKMGALMMVRLAIGDALQWAGHESYNDGSLGYVELYKGCSGLVIHDLRPCTGHRDMKNSTSHHASHGIYQTRSTTAIEFRSGACLVPEE